LLSIFNKNNANDAKNNESKPNPNKTIIDNQERSTTPINNNTYNTEKISNNCSVIKEKNSFSNIALINQNKTSNDNSTISPLIAYNINKNTEIISENKLDNFSLLKKSNDISALNNLIFSTGNNTESVNDRLTVSTKANSRETNLSYLDGSSNVNIKINELKNLNNNYIKENINKNSVIENGTLQTNNEKDLDLNKLLEEQKDVLDKKPFSRVSDSIFLKMNIYSNTNAKNNMNNTLDDKENKNNISNPSNNNNNNLIVIDEKSSNIDNHSKINLDSTKQIQNNFKEDKNTNKIKTSLKSDSTEHSINIETTVNNFKNSINDNNNNNNKININPNTNNTNNIDSKNNNNMTTRNQENKSLFSRASDASNNSDSGSTAFSVLDAQMVNVFDSNSISSNNNFDSFCEAFLISGAALHNPQTVLDSEKFPAFCGHEMCSSFEAYKPQIIYRYPLKDSKQLELNSLVINLIFIAIFKFHFS
jgi:hypothetical protein